jgi:hypothetical protein
MRRIILSLLGLLLLVACGPSSATTDPTTSEAPTAVPPQAPTLPAAQPAEAGFPATTPEEAGVVRQRDWTKGAAEPVVTIIEYGDFQ